MPTRIKEPILEFKGKRYFHIKTACAVLGISRPTGDNLISEGAMGFLKIAGKVYIPESDIDALFRVEYKKKTGPKKAKKEAK